MYRLIKQVFIAILSFSGSFATKFVSLLNETWISRPTIINLNLTEFNYY